MMVDIKEQNTLPLASQQSILDIVETLKSHKCRPIPESELGLALLFVSLDKYCNPSINAVPPLTQNLVSQSFQAADIMSQRACSEQLTVQFKKPAGIPVRHCKDDRTQDTRKQGLASSNIDKSMKTAYVGKRCNSTNSVADESIPDNQSVSSVKKRKVMDIETAGTTLVTESMDESNPENMIQGNLNLELADSIVADSLETKLDSSSNFDLEPLECKKQLMSKVENVAESLDVNENSAVVMDEAYGCQGKEEKADEQNRLSSLLVRQACGASQRDTLLTDQDNGYEWQASQSLHSATPSDHQDAAEPSYNFHVPQGFLWSKISRKVSRKCLNEDEDAHLPCSLVVVDHMSLVVRTVTTSPTLEKTSHSTTTKNFKKFKKQTYPGSSIGLPRIIGGSDLAIYQCAGRLDKDEWFLEAREADVERQREERLAEELFRWEERPTKTRRLKR